MDALDVIAGPADPLLRRVDGVLTDAGGPVDHRVWAELRRVRLLPGDAVEAVAKLRAAELWEAVTDLRADARAYADVAESLPLPGRWKGAAAEAYDEVRGHAAEHLSGGAGSLDERLEATADLAGALADWIHQTRGDLAGTLGEVLGSAEAVVLTSATAGDPATPDDIRAAADVAARVLQCVAESYELAADLLRASADLTEAVPAPGYGNGAASG